MSERRAMIVTGASSGIGRALAERAARSGFDVFAVGRRVERLRELARAVSEASGTLEYLAIDLQTPDAAKRIVAQTVAKFGRLDVLVNCAGGTAAGPIARQSDAQLREQFETHAIVPLALTREALPFLRAARGHVFYFGSGVARVPVGGLGAYPPAKAAVRSMARIVRNELRGDGIAVTYVDPGAVATEFMTRAGFAGPPKMIAALPQNVAKAIFEAIETRKAVVNAVGWQTTFVAIGEMFPHLTDFFLRLAPGIVGTAKPDNTKSPIKPAAPKTAASFALAPTISQDVSPIDSQTQSQSTLQASTATSLAAEHVPLTSDVLSLDDALEPVAARMKKLNLSRAFVGALLEPGRELELGDVAMRWAGMPNKNERAVTREVLEALANAGLLAREAEDHYRVMRAP